MTWFFVLTRTDANSPPADVDLNETARLVVNFSESARAVGFGYCYDRSACKLKVSNVERGRLGLLAITAVIKCELDWMVDNATTG